jgi:hypothetical protein
MKRPRAISDAIKFALTLLFLICVSGAQAQSPETKPSELSSAGSPQATLVTFYHWYLEALSKDRNPIRDDHAKMSSYVSSALLRDIDKRFNSPEGFDQDYFIRAQDYLTDWVTKIVVSNVHISSGVASATVTLGSTNETKHLLTVELINEGGAWKISRVSQGGGLTR